MPVGVNKYIQQSFRAQNQHTKEKLYFCTPTINYLKRRSGKQSHLQEHQNE